MVKSRSGRSWIIRVEEQIGEPNQAQVGGRFVTTFRNAVEEVLAVFLGDMQSVFNYQPDSNKTRWLKVLAQRRDLFQCRQG